MNLLQPPLPVTPYLVLYLSIEGCTCLQQYDHQRQREFLDEERDTESDTEQFAAYLQKCRNMCQDSFHQLLNVASHH